MSAPRQLSPPAPLTWVLLDAQIFSPIHREPNDPQVLSAGWDDGHMHTVQINRIVVQHLLGDEAQESFIEHGLTILALPDQFSGENVRDCNSLHTKTAS